MVETSDTDGVKVSVIIPCYNLGRYLDEAVESVQKQTFQDFEILVVDDGSTDPDTRSLLEEYERPRLQLVRSENRGLPCARNLGLAHTTGDYVCMLDADDLLEPAYLEKSVAVLDQDPSVAFVSHWLRAFGDENWDWTPTECGFPALLDVNTVNGAALVRRSALDAVGGFDETMLDGCEDWDLWITLVERGFTGRILPEVLFQYRRRADSMSRVMNQADGHARLYRRLVEKHAETYKQHLAALCARREADIANLRRHTHDLELEYARWLAPELAKWRDDVAALERKRAARERLAEIARLEDERNRLRETVEHSEHERWLSEEKFSEERAQLRAESDRLSMAYEAARARVLELDAGMNQARHEVRALHNSMSWLVTAPLRTLYGAVRRVIDRGKS